MGRDTAVDAANGMPPFDVVVVAASTGGVRALGDLVASLPAGFPVPVVVVQHRTPVPDLLPEILRRRSVLPVAELTQPGALGPAVFVVPARHACVLDRGRLRVDGEVPNGQADQVMSTVARNSDLRTCAVVLTGRGSDGAAGARAVKSAGGWVLVQDPADATAPEMPTAALATGCVDLVLPLRVLGPALVALAMAPGVAEMFRRPAAPWADLSAS